MTLAKIAAPDYDARIRRARHLASLYPFSAEVLSFYGQLAAFQKELHDKIARARSSIVCAEGQLRSELKWELLLTDFPRFLSLLKEIGPSPVKDAAQQLLAQRSREWGTLLSDYWTFGGQPHESRDADDEGGEPLSEFILRAFLQPYGEFLAARMEAPQLETTARGCPRCGSAPLLGVLRPEGDGGKRYLTCSFCLREWEFRRIFCPACGQDAEEKLPVYVAEQFPHIRVESCDTCKFYVRTIDLTKDGHAVPMVDDLSAIPLSLWAHQHGYTRLQANLLGT